MDSLVVLGSFGAVGIVVGAVVSRFAADWFRDRKIREYGGRIEDLEDHVFLLDQRYRSLKGVAAREESDGKLEEAISDPEVIALVTSDAFKTAGLWDKLKMAGPIVIKHPILAKWLIKNGGKLLK